jgi:hypothetical protein
MGEVKRSKVVRDDVVWGLTEWRGGEEGDEMWSYRETLRVVGAGWLSEAEWRDSGGLRGLVARVRMVYCGLRAWVQVCAGLYKGDDIGEDVVEEGREMVRGLLLRVATSSGDGGGKHCA